MRLRFRYTKLGKVKWTSHRDVARMWERAIRRVQLPVAYSSGFSPRPKISFGLALPTGAESVGEFLDIDLAADVEIGGLANRLSAALPAGLDVTAVAAADGNGSLQQDVVACAWEIDVAECPDLGERVERVVAATEVMVRRERKGQTSVDDIRPAIHALSVESPHEGRLHCELATQPRGLRPAELLDALGVEIAHAAVCRIHQWIERDGARWEPLLPDAARVQRPRAGVMRRELTDVDRLFRRFRNPHDRRRPDARRRAAVQPKFVRG